MTTRPTDACTGAPPAAWVAPSDGTSIPANAPALVWSADTAATTPTLAGRELVVSRFGDFALLVPKVPLTEGNDWDLSYPDPRAAGGIAHAKFKTGPTAALPMSFGSITASAPARRRLMVDASGSCAEEIDAAVVDVTVQPSKDLEPWLPLVRFTASVDGVPWASPKYGTRQPAPPVPSSGYRNTRGVERIFANCATGATNGDHGVTPGRHVLTIAAHVAGATSDPPPVSVEIELRCDEPADEVDGCSYAAVGRHLALHGPLGLAAAIALAGRRRRRP